MEQSIYNYCGKKFGALVGTLQDADFDYDDLLSLAMHDAGAIYARFDSECGANWDRTGDWIPMIVSPQNNIVLIYNNDGDWEELEQGARTIEDAFTAYFEAAFDN